MSSQKYKFSWLLAKRDILEEKRISLIVVAMLSFSFLNLVFFPSFISGLSNLFTDNIVETQTGEVIIEAEQGRFANADAIVKKVESLNAVHDVEKRLTFTAQYTHKSTTISIPTIGTDHLSPSVYQQRLVSGQLLNTDDSNEILLGKSVAKEEDISGEKGLGVREGRIIQAAYNNTARQLKVVGVIGQPGPSPLSQQAFVSYSTAADILDAHDEATSIKILLNSDTTPEQFKKQLQQLNTPGEIRTWREVSDLGSNIEGTFSIVTFVVSTVGLIIAITSVGVVIFINSSKRRREMGIIRSIGVESSQVLQIFVLEALIFGVLGVIVGSAIMLGIHNYLQANPIQAPIGTLSTDLTASLLITRSIWMLAAALVAGFIPAYLVSKQSIIDAIESR
jgi:lipoprotein-releasing system permease protein